MQVDTDANTGPIALRLQLEAVPFIAIANGTHQYVHIELRLATSGSSGIGVVTKRIVRSYRGLKSHAENYRVAMQRTLATLAGMVTATQEGDCGSTVGTCNGGSESHGAGVRLSARVIGGGRITCDHERRTASVFGYSRTFGRVEGCNKRTAGLISTHLQYTVSWTDGGY